MRAGFMPDGAVINSTSTNTTDTVQLSPPDAELLLSIDRGYITDLGAFLSEFSDVSIPLSTLPPDDALVALNVTVGFCTPHWKFVNYDPTMPVLFAALPNPNSPPSRASSAWIAAVAVVVPVIVILAILSIVVWKFRFKVQSYIVAEASK